MRMYAGGLNLGNLAGAANASPASSSPFGGLNFGMSSPAPAAGFGGFGQGLTVGTTRAATTTRKTGTKHKSTR